MRMAGYKKIVTLKTNPYEIAKAADIDYGFQSIAENAALIIQLATQAEHDFIIGGTVIPGNGLSVIIKPFIAVCKATGKLYCSSEDITVELTIASAVHDRIDVLSITGEGWESFQEEKRAKWYVTGNPPGASGQNNDSMVFGSFDKRQTPKIETSVLQGPDNAESAPLSAIEHIKIAEITIRAGREKLDAADIHFVSANEDGMQNKNWTQEKAKTFFIAPISEALRRFFKIHRPDGTLKDGVVGKNNLKLSHGDRLTAGDIALGTDIEERAAIRNHETNKLEYIMPIVGRDRLDIKILQSTTIKNTFDIVFRTFVFVWKAFIKSDIEILRRTDKGLTDLNNALTEKIDKETKERKEADAAEKQAREQAIEKEREDRDAAIAQETKARKEADVQEAEARKAADETEKKEREKAIAEEARERQEAIAQEAKERIEGDKRTEALAKEAISLSAPIGTAFELYDDKEHQTFLKADGSIFDPQKYPKFYDYWKNHLSFLGEDEYRRPYLPYIEQYDDSMIGQIAFFIGEEYHHEFLQANGLPFSPTVYQEFYEQYWKKYYAHLGTDPLTGWPIRPTISNTSGITGTFVYIRALPHENSAYTTPFIKTGEQS